MTKHCLKSISPDSLTGMLFALEGMQNTVVLLNGPMGCKFYHSTTSDFLTPHPPLYLPSAGGQKVPVDYNYLNDWFFRQERIPSTYLDGYDYVYGTKEKVREALDYIRTNVDFSLFGIVNSPGASLIGDELLGITRDMIGKERVVMLESPGFSTSFEEGYSAACTEILRQLAPASQEKKPHTADGKKRINLLGLSIWHRYFHGDLEEITRLCSLCGIEVRTALCAGNAVADLFSMAEADLNVVLDPAMGLEAAQLLEAQYGTPYYVCESLPVGFDATEKCMNALCSMLGTDPGAFQEEAERARARAWYTIHQVYQSSGKPEGVKFSVVGNAAQEASYTAFLRDYLGMVPAEPEQAELVFSDANVISELMLKNKTFCGIEIALPGMGYIDVVNKTHFGTHGALFLIEQVLNGLMSRLD